MDRNWVSVFTTTKNQAAVLMMNLLEQNEIAAVTMNRIDSAYPLLGEIMILVHPDDVIRAKHLINKNLTP
ncbi:MAG: DUF2007 domain-containing protein [Flavobacteriales bacterium]|nr:DUF2007 domain-containing protein [Flavobacteriales bacterium]MCB9448826.1 DUF2007 domain-containing protein [Flavobacteriales bacterium]